MKIERSIKYTIAIIGMTMLLVYVFLVGWGKTGVKGDQLLTADEKEWLNSQGSLIYAADNNAPPLRFVDKSDNQYKGVVVDYINILSLELGINIELHPLLWEDALRSLSEGKTDICDMFMSEERSKYFLFSDPIYNLRAIVVSRDGSEDITSMYFATQKGDYVNEYLLNRYPGINLKYVDNVSSAMDLLIAGEVDAVAGDEPVVLHHIRNKGIEGKFHINEEPLYDKKVVFAIPKSKPELLPILNKGIAAIKDSDQLERIQQKWFGISTPIVQSPDYSDIIKYVLTIGIILFLVVIGMTTWNYSLKKEVDKRTKEVINSKNDLQITFDGMTEYIAVSDLDLKVVNINQSFLDFLGLAKHEVLNKHCREIFEKFNADDLEYMIKETIKNERTSEREITSKNNYYVVRTYPLKNVLEDKKNILVVIQNITKEKISEKQILQANKMAAIGQLAAGIGHEIRNPLGIIRNHSYIIRSNSEDGKTVRSLDYIDSSVDRTNRIIDNLLEFSRLTDDTKSWINLKEFISKLLVLENKTFMKRNIDCVLDCNEDLKVYSNAESIKHILINLISNAVDAIDENGTIDIIVFPEDQHMVLRIEDTGKGIPEDEIEKIFNPFYTTKDPDKGTGLGLYIVYNEVKKLNGDILVTSFQNVKTIFEVILPIEEERELID